MGERKRDAEGQRKGEKERVFRKRSLAPAGSQDRLCPCPPPPLLRGRRPAQRQDQGTAPLRGPSLKWREVGKYLVNSTGQRIISVPLVQLSVFYF